MVLIINKIYKNLTFNWNLLLVLVQITFNLIENYDDFIFLKDQYKLDSISVSSFINFLIKKSRKFYNLYFLFKDNQKCDINFCR